MPRSKSTPTKRGREEEEEEPPPKKASPIKVLRVRHPGGTVSVTEVTGSLNALWTRLKRELKAPVTTASFRDADGQPVTLLSNGEYPAGGLAIGPDTDVSTVLANGDSLTVSTEKPSAKRALGKTLSKAIEGPSAAESLDSIAATFISSHVGEESLMGTASAMYVTQQGQTRVQAASKGLVRLIKRTPKHVHLAYKSTPKGKEREDHVRLLSTQECLDLVVSVFNRQAGSRRRRLSCDKPSTRLLTIDSVASRCATLFWSLYVHSKPDGDDDAPGDVPYMLHHVIAQATDAFKAQVQADRAQDQLTAS